ncbi:DUF2087 domain-containing protein [Micromonospora sp. HNM0581]|uniref:DUF2087 domain-containing protein n=1 Tax=Micromonospora sp. HNM0581 TaxID=2716341 RepID=UPI00146B33C8|nr:DUF2087 domain-containing protein [Micromonospora sp. HNM0581]
MEATDVIKALADPQRFRVLAAVVLGASDRDEIGARSGVDVRGVLAATARLESLGLLTGEAGALRVDYEKLRDLLRAEAAPAAQEDIDRFVQDGRLSSLPSKRSRRHAVLAHIVEQSFEAGSTYDEKAVNVVLERWCEGSAVDHVAMRRYLIDHQLMFRVQGVYARTTEVLPAPGEAEKYMDAIGLD